MTFWKTVGAVVVGSLAVTVGALGLSMVLGMKRKV